MRKVLIPDNRISSGAKNQTANKLSIKGPEMLNNPISTEVPGGISKGQKCKNFESGSVQTLDGDCDLRRSGYYLRAISNCYLQGNRGLATMQTSHFVSVIKETQENDKVGELEALSKFKLHKIELRKGTKAFLVLDLDETLISASISTKPMPNSKRIAPGKFVDFTLKIRLRLSKGHF